MDESNLPSNCRGGLKVADVSTILLRLEHTSMRLERSCNPMRFLESSFSRVTWENALSTWAFDIGRASNLMTPSAKSLKHWFPPASWNASTSSQKASMARSLSFLENQNSAWKLYPSALALMCWLPAAVGMRSPGPRPGVRGRGRSSSLRRLSLFMCSMLGFTTLPIVDMYSLSRSLKTPSVSPVYSWKYLFTVLISINTSRKKCMYRLLDLSLYISFKSLAA